MQELRHIICQKKNVKWLLALELLAVAVFGLVVVLSFSGQEIVFGENDMQVKRGKETEAGNYLDVSFEDAEAVVTPPFQTSGGVYYIEASFARHGIVRAGLIYDKPRNGNQLVDDDDFIVNQDKQVISYRVRTHDDSRLRFKLRLTGDAGEGDYVQLLQVRIIPSRVTCAFRIFLLAVLMMLADLLLWGYMRYYRKWEAEKKIVFSVLVCTAFFVSLPLLQGRLTDGADLEFHLSRLEGIYQELKSGGGQFPVRIQPGWLDGYGYAVSVFYGDILLYIPALLRIIGFTLEEAYKIYLGGVNIATVFLAFYAFKKMARNDVAAMAGSVLYAGSMVRISMLYTAMTGSVSAMMFYPLIAAGFYLLFTQDTESEEYKRTWILLTAGFTGILMTHMLSCLIIGVYSVLLCVVMIKRLLRKNTFLALVKAAGMTVLLSLWYLVPLLQYMVTEKLRINAKMAHNEEVEDYYAALEDFRQEGKSLFQLFTDENTLGFAALLVLVVFVVTLSIQGKDRFSRRTRVFSLFALFSLFACTNLFPVVALARTSGLLMKLFRTIQYQYRLMGVAAVMTACLAVLFLATDLFDKKRLGFVAAALCCITLYQNLQYFSTLTFDQVYLDGIALEARTDKELYSYTAGNGEYLPVVTDTTRFTNEIESSDGIYVGQMQREDLSFAVTAENTSAQEGQILFPVLYYSGYRAVDAAGHEKLATAIGDNGRVAVTVPPGYAGSFQLEYCEPPLWRMAELISAVAFVVVILTNSKLKGWKKWMPTIAEKGVANGN